jgi:serine/threonine-protein kinase
MSPEQIKGALDLDPRSDLYSLGVSLYEVVTGARPFQGDSEYSIMAAHLEKNPPPPIQVSPNLPAGLNEVILQALEKDPAKRFQTADAFRAALIYVCKTVIKESAPAVPKPMITMSQPSIPPPPPEAPLPQQAPPLQEARVSGSRRGLWITVGALIVVAVIVVVAMQLPKFRQTAAENVPAQQQVQTTEPALQPAAVPAAAQPEQTQEEASAPLSTSNTPQPQVSSPVREPVTTSTPASQFRPANRPAKVSSAAAPVQYTPPSQSVTMATPSAPAQTAATPPPEPAEDPRIAEQLKEVREQLNLLSIRMDTVKSSLNTLRRQQAASGLGLRADMTNAAQRMEYCYSQSEAALNRRDAETAKKNLDLAEREVDKLEKFLGK